MTAKPAYSAEDLNDIFGIGRSMLDRMVKNGLPVCVLVPGGRAFRIKHDDLMAYLDANKTASMPLEVPDV